MHGKGIFTWPSGERYEGEYYEDQKHGEGRLTYSDGSYYQGEWRGGVR